MCKIVQVGRAGPGKILLKIVAEFTIKGAGSEAPPCLIGKLAAFLANCQVKTLAEGNKGCLRREMFELAHC